MKRILFSLLFISNAYFVSGFNNLTVSDPRTSWMTQKGTISEASVSVRTSGAFSEVSMYLTFSAQNTSYANTTDSLEVVLDFDLPLGAHITDSWLWIGDDIIQALMLDRSQATQIYESIVKRRKDPSILYKNSPTQYQLRIFPMLGNASRKVKITFLMPATLHSNTSVTDIPLGMMNVSNVPLSNLSCMAFDNNQFTNPTIQQFPNLSFNAVSINEPLKGKKINLNSLSGMNTLSVQFDHNINTNNYFRTFTNNGITYYQLAFDHMKALGIEKPAKKTVFVLDYESPTPIKTSLFIQTYTGYYFDTLTATSGNKIYGDTSKIYKTNIYNFNDIKQGVKNMLLQKFSEGEYFNFVYSKNGEAIKNTSTWTEATPANITTEINKLDSGFANKSSLVYSLPAAYTFLKENGGGSIFLITNRNIYNNLTATGGVLDQIANINFKADRIDVYDFSNTVTINNTNNPYNYGYWYYNFVKINYLNTFSKLSPFTKYYNPILTGIYSYYAKWNYNNYYNYKNFGNAVLSSFTSVFDSYFEKLSNINFTAFIDKGYNYDEHLLGLSSGSTANPYGQLSLVGKYEGTMPFTLRLSTKYKGKQYNATLVYTTADTIATNGLLRKFWAGHQINYLEKQCSDNNSSFYYYYTCTPDVETRRDIAKTSLENRVLSRYTAFFAPEIGFLDVKACTTCVDESDNNFENTALASDFGQPSFGGVIITSTNSVNVDSLFKEMAFEVFPNPAHSSTTIQFNKPASLSAADIKLEIYNMQGSIVKTIQNLEVNDNQVKYTLNLTDNSGNSLPKGLYLVAVNIKGVKKLYKLVVE